MRTMILGIALATACSAAPATVAAQARAISAADRQTGAQAHPQLMREFGGAFTGPQAAYVTRVGRRVATQSGLSNAGTDFTVTTLNSAVENAFAIPGGYIYITRQLLALMNSEAELASVLGHEVGHVAARHAAGRNSRSTIGQVLAAGARLATGNELVGQAVSTGARLYTLRYGREQEYQADALGIRYMTGAGYSPYAAADILAALDESSTLTNQGGRSLPTWASSHPNGQDRVQRAVQLAQDTGRPEPSPTVQDTAFLRMLNGLPYGEAAARQRISIVTVGARDTVQSLSARMATTAKRERFLLLNGLTDDAALRPGMLVKLVVSG